MSEGAKKKNENQTAFFTVADTVTLLHIMEIWDCKVKELVVCKVPSLQYAPENSYCKYSKDGWAGSGLYAAAPAYNWIKSYRAHLEIPPDNIYAKVMKGRERFTAIEGANDG